MRFSDLPGGIAADSVRFWILLGHFLRFSACWIQLTVSSPTRLLAQFSVVFLMYRTHLMTWALL